MAFVVRAGLQDRLGLRLSPFGRYGGVCGSNTLELFTFVIRELNRRRIVYLHLIEARSPELGTNAYADDPAAAMAAQRWPASCFLSQSKVYAITRMCSCDRNGNPAKLYLP